ncbi:MAG: hypothetical protein LUG66_11270 [Clostridiales bacterium]|nr:hypothetical protein [Clostridiales bacterium]
MSIGEFFEKLMKTDTNAKNEKDIYKSLLKTAGITNPNSSDKAVIRTLAECIAKNSFDKLDSLNDVYISSNKWLGVFTDLIPEKWLISRRQIPIMATFTYENFKVKVGEYVKKGTYIADIVSWGKGKACAMKSGVVLETSRHGVIIGSPFDDVKKFKAWKKLM